jgi:hypothetical protein
MSHRLYDTSSYPEGDVCSPAKSFIGQPINIKIPIPVGKVKQTLFLKLIIRSEVYHFTMKTISQTAGII